MVFALLTVQLEGADDGVAVAHLDGAVDGIRRVGHVHRHAAAHEDGAVAVHLEEHHLLVHLLAAELTHVAGRGDVACGDQHVAAQGRVGQLEEPLVFLVLHHADQARAVHLRCLGLGLAACFLRLLLLGQQGFLLLVQLLRVLLPGFFQYFGLLGLLLLGLAGFLVRLLRLRLSVLFRLVRMVLGRGGRAQQQNAEHQCE